MRNPPPPLWPGYDPHAITKINRAWAAIWKSTSTTWTPWGTAMATGRKASPTLTDKALSNLLHDAVKHGHLERRGKHHATLSKSTRQIRRTTTDA